ncbi:MAG: DUF1467 family protein [Alphaproteobacteria bacterium]|nr:DUF1467 family protein [Alphaproteobacteria bacterium]
MGWISGIVVYVLIWWTALFAVLPFGLTRQQDGKPENPKLKQKIIITSLLSALIWVVVYVLIKIDIIDFHSYAKAMMDKDNLS